MSASMGNGNNFNSDENLNNEEKNSLLSKFCCKGEDKSKEKIETEKQIDKIYNSWYHDKHIINKVKKHSLIKDKRDQVVYDRNPGILNARQEFIIHILNSFTCVAPDNKEKYENTMRNIFSQLEKGNVCMVTNHDTFANIPILVAEMHKYADKFNKPEVKDSLHVILGPSLMTQTQKNVILSISNVRKTVPDTWNSDIPDIKNSENPKIKNSLNSIRLKFLKTILTELDEANKSLNEEGSKRKYGNLYFLAPTGMRDYLKWNNDCTIDSIIFEQDKELVGSLRFLKMIADKGTKIVLSGTNGVGMKRPSKVSEKDNKWVPADTYVSLEEIDNEECIDRLEKGIFMQKLSELVKDNDGNVIGKVLPRSEIKELWDNKQIDKMEEDNFRNFHFHDNMKKVTNRLLYRAFETIKVRYFIKNNAKNLLNVLKNGNNKEKK